MLNLPQTWAWASLADIANIKGGLTKGKRRKATDELLQIPYLRVANVQRGFLDLSEIKMIEATFKEIADLELQSGDILFNEGGDRDKLGRGWVWEAQIPTCIHQNHVFRARSLSSDINPYLISFFGNTFGQRYFLGQGKQSVNLASISLTKLKSLPVPVIPAAEQRVLHERLMRELRGVEAIERIIDNARDVLPTLDQSILARAFHGKPVPQDPNDEPASELLARIKAERAATGTPTRRGRRRKQNQPQLEEL